MWEVWRSCLKGSPTFGVHLADKFSTETYLEVIGAGIHFCMFGWLNWWQFRALSDQLYHSPEYHNFVRDSVVKQVSKFFCEFFHCVMVFDFKGMFLIVEDFLREGKWPPPSGLSAVSKALVLLSAESGWVSNPMYSCGLTDTMEIYLPLFFSFGHSGVQLDIIRWRGTQGSLGGKNRVNLVCI